MYMQSRATPCFNWRLLLNLHYYVSIYPLYVWMRRAAIST